MKKVQSHKRLTSKTLVTSWGARSNRAKYLGPEKPLSHRDSPHIGIYTGSGTSHSWLWFVDLFDRHQFYNVHLIDELDIQKGQLHSLDVLCMSGGDTFRIAGCLGEQGASEIKRFVQHGGIYIGTCAGAYLPLKSSKEPLNLFNFVNARITNLTQVLPHVRKMPHKFCTRYGCAFVFHPVRDEVELSIKEPPPLFETNTVLAPLYGGPPMIPSACCQTIATYRAFTDRTIFLVDREIAEKTVLGNAAVIRSEMEQGVFYLFGPHFEHPAFHEANTFLLESILMETKKRAGRVRPTLVRPAKSSSINTDGDFLRQLKRNLSNSRIVAAGLEMRPIHWTIGNKVYEPEKIRVFLDAPWKRIVDLSGLIPVGIGGIDKEHICDLAERTCALLRGLKRCIDDEKDSNAIAEAVFFNLNRLAASVLNLYFRTLQARA